MVNGEGGGEGEGKGGYRGILRVEVTYTSYCTELLRLLSCCNT